jgi:hypothetical protein
MLTGTHLVVALGLVVLLGLMALGACCSGGSGGSGAEESATPPAPTDPTAHRRPRATVTTSDPETLRRNTFVVTALGVTRPRPHQPGQEDGEVTAYLRPTGDTLAREFHHSWAFSQVVWVQRDVKNMLAWMMPAEGRNGTTTPGDRLVIASRTNGYRLLEGTARDLPVIRRQVPA